MGIKSIEEQLEAVQRKYGALGVLKGSSVSAAAPNLTSTLIQFTANKLKPTPNTSVKVPPEKSAAIQAAMLTHILETYGKNGKDILFPRDEKLLPTYIEAYVEQLEVSDPKGDLHTILAIVREAGEKLGVESKPESVEKPGPVTKRIKRT